MNEDNSLSYFFLGLGVGIAAGILFAPKSGEETRQLLMSKADEGKDYLRSKSDELRDTANDAVERGKVALQRQKENLSAAVDAGKQAYRESVATAPSYDGPSV